MPVAFQGVLRDSTGYKLVSSMGWEEGQGLVQREIEVNVFEEMLFRALMDLGLHSI